MIKVTIECENCHSESEIREEKLMFPEEKSVEEAYCPECEKEVYKGETDGWFHVTLKKDLDKSQPTIKYPMA